MAHLHYLHIENFRGIENFSNTFGSENYCVLIGRGDSGKSTILKAISLSRLDAAQTAFNHLSDVAQAV